MAFSYSSTILVIIISNLTMSKYRFAPPQVKQNLISDITNLVYEVPQVLPNDFRFTKLGNKEILEKS